MFADLLFLLKQVEELGPPVVCIDCRLRGNCIQPKRNGKPKVLTLYRGGEDLELLSMFYIGILTGSLSSQQLRQNFAYGRKRDGIVVGGCVKVAAHLIFIENPFMHHATKR